ERTSSPPARFSYGAAAIAAGRLPGDPEVAASSGGGGRREALGEPALETAGGVPMDQILPRRAVEQALRARPILDGRAGRACLLQCGAERRALRAVAHRGG